MLEDLLCAWRTRRVLLCGGTGRAGRFMQALLEELGARPARIAPGADSETLFRALSEGRISTVVCFQQDAFSGGLAARLSALEKLLCEMREAGVPLFILCSDTSVYRHCSAMVREGDPHDGMTQEGFMQSMLEQLACAMSRGLMGDAVHALCIRHAPLLGCAHPAVSICSRWCHALDADESLFVTQPEMTNVFMHPLDACCGALLLGARFFLHGFSCTGAFNIGAGSANLMTNRRAALRFLARNGGRRPIIEAPGGASLPPAPDGAHARLLAGVRCMLPAEEALSLLLSLERAAAEGTQAESAEILRQTQLYLKLLP